VTGRFWYDWVKPTVHLSVEEMGEPEDIHPCKGSAVPYLSTKCVRSSWSWQCYSMKISTRVKVQLYNSLVLAVLSMEISTRVKVQLYNSLVLAVLSMEISTRVKVQLYNSLVLAVLSMEISTRVKVQLYNSLVMALLLYEDIDPCKGPAVQLTSTGSVTLWSRDQTNDIINDHEVVSSTSQVAQEDLTHFVER